MIMLEILANILYELGEIALQSQGDHIESSKIVGSK